MDQTREQSQSSSWLHSASAAESPLILSLPSSTEETQSTRIRRFWNKIQLYMKLFMTTFVILLIIFWTVRQLFNPINGGIPEEPLQKILSMLDSLDAEIRQYPRLLPLTSQWNGTLPLN